jgi:cytochrome c oxidase assembly protein subunit 15
VAIVKEQKKMTDSDDVLPDRGLRPLAILLAAVTLLLLVAGALVTSNEAGDSVPDWPLSFGRWLIQSSHFVANVRYEYSHRVIAATVGLITATLALRAWTKERRPLIQKLALMAFAGVLAQAMLGGIRVWFPAYKPVIAVLHALFAQSFFGLVIALVILTSADWWEPKPLREDVRFPSTRWLALITVCAVLTQLVLGAGFRHGAFGVIPHAVGALVVSSLVIWTALIILHRYQGDAYLGKPVLAMLVLLSGQVALGVLAYVARLKSRFDVQPLEPMISLTVAHVVVGALTLASVVVLTLRCWRTLTPSRETIRQAQSSFNPAGKIIAQL